MKTEIRNVTSVQEGIIVHGCNALSVMGAGVALAIKQKYPLAFRVYVKDLLEKQQANIDPLGTVTIVPVREKLFVANGITQRSISFLKSVRNVDYDAVRSVFKQVAGFAKPRELPIFYPKIGAGLGGGDWDVISKIIEEELGELDHTLCLV